MCCHVLRLQHPLHLGFSSCSILLDITNILSISRFVFKIWTYLYKLIYNKISCRIDLVYGARCWTNLFLKRRIKYLDFGFLYWWNLSLDLCPIDMWIWRIRCRSKIFIAQTCKKVTVLIYIYIQLFILFNFKVMTNYALVKWKDSSLL